MLDEFSCRVVVQVQRAFYAHGERGRTLEKRFLVELRPKLLPISLLNAILTVLLSTACAIRSRTVLLYDHNILYRATFTIILASPIW